MNPTGKGLEQAWKNFNKGQKALLYKKKQEAIDAINSYLNEIKKTELALYRLGCYEEMLETELNEKVQAMTLKISAREEAHQARAERSRDPAMITKVAYWKEMQRKMNPIATGSSVSSDIEGEDVSRRMEDVTIDEKSTGPPRKKKQAIVL